MQGKKIVTDSDDDLGGGIDLKKAKERMREEDKKDKEIYRQRVKVMHRVVVLTTFTCYLVIVLKKILIYNTKVAGFYLIQ